MFSLSVLDIELVQALRVSNDIPNQSSGRRRQRQSEHIERSKSGVGSWLGATQSGFGGRGSRMKAFVGGGRRAAMLEY